MTIHVARVRLKTSGKSVLILVGLVVVTAINPLLGLAVLIILLAIKTIAK